MFDLEELLNPVSQDLPSGQDLRYSPVYDRIKEALREDDDLPQGSWHVERKIAEFPTALKLITKALTESKDLRLAVWYCQAALGLARFGGLARGLQLCDALLNRYWDTLHPELEDGDDELRAATLEWLDSKLSTTVRLVPLTAAGHSYVDYSEARRLGYASEIGTETQRRLFEAARREGKPDAQEMDMAFAATPAERFQAAAAELHLALEALQELKKTFERRFSSDTVPSLAKLERALVDVHHLCDRYVRERAPSFQQSFDPATEIAAVTDSLSARNQAFPAASQNQPAVTAPIAAPDPNGPPANASAAVAKIIAAAKYLREHDPYNPFSYATIRAYRWGELRCVGQPLDPALLAAPPTIVRVRLKKVASAGDWQNLLAATEEAMAEEYGRGWLDLQRHACRACESLGAPYSAARNAIIAALRDLLDEFPMLPVATLADDTPTASMETQAWIRSEILPGRNTPAEAAAVRTSAASPLIEKALGMAARGEPDAGVRLLTADIARQTSERERFSAKARLAEYCLSAGYYAMALSIFEEITAFIETLQLQRWESGSDLAKILALYYAALVKVGSSPDLRDRVYGRICQLDPSQAPPR